MIETVSVIKKKQEGAHVQTDKYLNDNRQIQNYLVH